MEREGADPAAVTEDGGTASGEPAVEPAPTEPGAPTPPPVETPTLPSSNVTRIRAEQLVADTARMLETAKRSTQIITLAEAHDLYHLLRQAAGYLQSTMAVLSDPDNPYGFADPF